jgi:purine nucleosidase
MKPCFTRCLLIVCLLPTSLCLAQAKRKIIINQDCSGPGGSNLQTLALLIQSPNVEVLGITVVSGDQWRDEEVAHALRLLEIMRRTDIPVVPGAVVPLVRRRDEAQLWQARYGTVAYAGAWDDRWWHEPNIVPPLAEGQPTTKPSSEDAAHFLLRMVHKYPHEITIYEGGPMTNLATAIRIDPEFPTLAKELVFMGGSLSPLSDNPEWTNNPRHEFNFWFDPEAAHNTFRAKWPRIDVTTVDISLKAMFTQEMIDAIAKSPNPAAQYIAKFSQERYYMWDELAACAWLDPSIITKEKVVYMDVNIDHGPTYGDTLTWTEKLKPAENVQLAHAQLDVDLPKFTKIFEEIMMRPTPAPAPH